MKKLEEIMQKIGVKDVQNGSISEKMRSCIDKLHYHFVVANRSVTSVHKPKFLTKESDTRRCPMSGSEVSISRFCSKCHDRTPSTWAKCSTMLADQGIGKQTTASSGQPFKGAIR